MVKEPFISLVLPETVLGDNRLTYFERILLIDIVSLCKKNGYCWPTNRYFMKKFDCTKPTVSKSISSLSKNGYIDIEINNSEKNNSKRIIRLSEVLKKRIMSIQGNISTSVQNNFNYYNKYNKNKRDILDKIYYVDEFGIEYWHGEPIESKEATKEEQEEMEKMLESFKEMANFNEKLICFLLSPTKNEKITFRKYVNEH